MKKYIVIAAMLLAAVSCQSLKEEFQPVVTFGYEDPAPYKYYTDADFSKIITIKELAGQYTPGKPFEMPKDKDILKGAVIKGVVSSTDQPGNFYKSFFIQDET
ncbi:MAG: DUF5689 domain-containing protein, partial [Bacteroidales bacterium]|nr:DUF5689 domain-containing protein [Bacteroidales bacterium]